MERMPAVCGTAQRLYVHRRYMLANSYRHCHTKTHQVQKLYRRMLVTAHLSECYLTFQSVNGSNTYRHISFWGDNKHLNVQDAKLPLV